MDPDLTIDVTDCDREPIHIPGAIQPHGVLLALDPSTLDVVQVAGDVTTLLGLDADALTGAAVQDALGPAALDVLDRLTADALLPRPLVLSRAMFGADAVDVSAYLSDGLIVLELETRGAADGQDPLELVQTMIRRVEAGGAISDLCEIVAQEVRRVTDYDRVMVYRFLQDDSGHVVAEARRSADVESFLDLHYPASDIPQQARRLYLSNWIRYIPDARYAPQAIAPPLNPLTGAPLDLSFSNLRSVSPVHLEYLANMGVRASMSLSLVVEGRLWGLVACHGLFPRFVSCRVRSALELFAQLASLQLQNRLAIEETSQRLRSSEIRADLVQAMTLDGLPEGLLAQEPDLLNLIRADGVAILADGRVTTKGLCPPSETLQRISSWLTETTQAGVYATDRLGEVWTGAGPAPHEAAGLLALSLSREPRDYVVWFLAEQLETVTWAGDKMKAVRPGAEGRLSPRSSFAAWSEVVRGRSRPWTAGELESAGALRVSILEVVLRRLDQVAKEREVEQARQDLLLAELDHRVKNTLATIQSMVRFSGRSAADLNSFVLGVERRLQAMAKTHNLLTQSRWDGVRLRALIEEQLAAHSISGGAGVTLEGEDFLLEPKAALAASMALHELVTNAVKHGCLSVGEGRLFVSWERVSRDDGAWLVLTWRETGGPEVASPERRGFGSMLLERVFGRDVGGRTQLSFVSTGLRCVLEIPAARAISLGPGAATATVAEPHADPVTSLDGLRILVLEDAPLVAADVAEHLAAMGAEVLGPFYRLPEALAFLERRHLDLALLDVDIDGVAVWPLADLLRERGVPFVLTTGFAGRAGRPPRFESAPLVNKPYDAAALVQVVRTLVSGRGA